MYQGGDPPSHGGCGGFDSHPVHDGAIAQRESRSFASSRFGVRIPVVPQRTEREAWALREYCIWYHAGKRRRSVERGRSSDGQSYRPEAGGRGFESRRPLVRFWGCSSMGEHLSGREKVVGSTPTNSTGTAVPEQHIPTRLIRQGEEVANSDTWKRVG